MPTPTFDSYSTAMRVRPADRATAGADHGAQNALPKSVVWPKMPFAERNGGWILAVCLHVTVFSLLIMQSTSRRPAEAPRRRPIAVTFAQPEPPAPTIETPAMVPEYEPAGDPDPATAAEIADEAAAESDVVEMAALPAGHAPDPTAMPAENERQVLIDGTVAIEPPTEQSVDMEELRRRHGDVLEALERRYEQMEAANRMEGMRGSDLIEQRLRLAQADQAAQKTLFHQPMLNPGVDRMIDIADVSLDSAQKVLDRYGIKIVLLDVKGPMRTNPGNGGTFLNRAVTETGVFVRPEGLSKGVYQAFTFGAIAESRMAQLEEEALLVRGLDPLHSRVSRVVFGLVPTPTGFDLGVKELVAEAIGK
jgi:hypothetical protein